jgi:hypothetical protein
MPSSRFLAFLAVVIGLYFAARFELHKTLAVRETAAAAFSAVYSPIHQAFLEPKPDVVISEERPQEVLTPVASSSGSTRSPYTRHIVAVGDLHGDIKNAQTVLEFSGVVDSFGNWTG